MNPIIVLDSTNGTVGTLVDISGAGFDPISTVTVTFDGATEATVTTTQAGTFLNVQFNIPLSSSIGPHTVKASQGGNSDSKTFTVTSSTTPAITLIPTSGPVGTSVDITGTGFSPNFAVTITFEGKYCAYGPISSHN